ncbi:MAG: PKD domain-containing protein [Planctomycetales bacterium]|nr:PKD domain-containing protein [bacterium]UNM08160.1 MAG: PKD domain-containing protein [Planctomycetales bacterium]
MAGLDYHDSSSGIDRRQWISLALLPLLAIALVYLTGGSRVPAAAMLQDNPPPPANRSPVARLSASAASGSIPLEVSFDGSTSEDPDGGALSFDWDLDGDGVFEVIGGTPVVTHTFTEAGIFTVTLRVTDNMQWQDMASVSVKALDGQTPSFFNLLAPTLAPVQMQKLDAPVAEIGSFEERYPIFSDSCDEYSLAIIQNLPTICFSRKEADGTHSLYYMAAKDSHGLSWNYPHQIYNDGSGSSVLRLPRLIEVSGTAAIAFHGYNKSSASTGIVYLRCLDLTGSAWLSPVSVADSIVGVNSLEFLIVNGKPALAYIEAPHTAKADGKLYYEQAVDKLGKDWSRDSQKLDQWANVISLSVVGGKPAIAFVGKRLIKPETTWTAAEFSPPETFYMTANDPDGLLNWNLPITVSKDVSYPDNVENDIELMEIDGMPAISWFGGVDPSTSNGRVGAAFYVFSGWQWVGTGSTPSDNGLSIMGIDLAMVGDTPCLSILRTHGLSLQSSSDHSGTFWQAARQVSPDPRAKFLGNTVYWKKDNIQLIEVDGRPAMLTRHGNGALMYIVQMKP